MPNKKWDDLKGALNSVNNMIHYIGPGFGHQSADMFLDVMIPFLKEHQEKDEMWNCVEIRKYLNGYYYYMIKPEYWLEAFGTDNIKIDGEVVEC